MVWKKLSNVTVFWWEGGRGGIYFQWFVCYLGNGSVVRQDWLGLYLLEAFGKYAQEIVRENNNSMSVHPILEKKCVSECVCVCLSL